MFLSKKTSGQIKTLRQQVENFENIFDQANDAIFVIDIGDGRIHYTNKQAAVFLKYELIDLLTKSLFDLHPEEMLGRSSEIIADVWEKGGLVYRDIPFISSENELLPVECSARVIPFQDRPTVLIYARDIRERIKLENEVLAQKALLEQKNKDITDSITYASTIQRAILPDESLLQQAFEEFFIFYKPKDIVSGDFYWFNQKGETKIIAAADCTGHGVPGALMSMIGNSVLNEIVIEKGISDPSDILKALDEKFIRFKEERNFHDAMDIAICRISPEGIAYSGSNRSLIIVNGEGLQEIKGCKRAIGSSEGLEEFKTTTLEPLPGSMLYIFSDGYADQFGGELNKKFTSKRQKLLFERIYTQTSAVQKTIIAQALEEWKGIHEQVDDVLVIGVRV